MTQGHKVVVGEFADNPMDAVAHHLSLQPMPQPDPARLAPHEVLIRIRSAAVGWVDLLMTSGQYQHMPEPPYTPGMEYTGEVLATGAAVDPAQVQVGDRVLADGLQVGPAVDATAGMQRAVPETLVIASGGVGTLADLDALRAADVRAVVLGRALYEGSFTLEEALARC